MLTVEERLIGSDGMYPASGVHLMVYTVWPVMLLETLSPEVAFHTPVAFTPLPSPLVPRTVHELTCVACQVTRTGLPFWTRSGFTLQVISGPAGGIQLPPEHPPAHNWHEREQLAPVSP